MGSMEALYAPSGVWSGAPATIEFGVFYTSNLRAGGSNINEFHEIQLTKFFKSTVAWMQFLHTLSLISV